MRVLLATQAWGWVADTAGNAVSGKTVTLTGTVMSLKTGGSVLSPVVSDSSGLLPGWIEEGTYTLTVDGSSVEVIAGAGGAAAAVEVSVLAYASSHGVDRGGGSSSDSAAGINAATADLSAEATALTALTGRAAQGRLIFPKGIYLADDLRPAKNVEWMLDQATLAKRTDSTGAQATNCLIYTPESLRAAVVSGTGATVNGSYFVGAITSIGSWRRGYPITGTGIPANTKVTHVDTLTNIVKLDKAATASATVTLTRGATYKGNYSNFRMSGGYLSANGKIAFGALCRMLWMDNMVIDNTTWTDYAQPYTPGGFLGAYALVTGGDNNRIEARVMGGPNSVHADGIHHTHGHDFRAVLDVDSGDDMLAIGSIITASLAAEPDPIDGVIADVQGSSTRGFALRVHVEVGVTTEVKNIQARVVARSGINRNGGIYIVDENHPAIGSELISNVTANVELNVGSASHDETNAVGVLVYSAKNVTVNGNIRMTDPTSPVTGFRLAYVRSAENTRLNVDCDQLALYRAVDAADTKGLKVGGRLIAGAALTDAVVYLGSNCEETDIGAEILNIPDAKNGIQATSGGTTTLTYSGPRIAHVSGATSGKGIYAASMSRLTVRGQPDLSACPEPIDLVLARAIPRLVIPDGIPGVSRASLITTFFDDFMGDLLADEWSGFKGSDGAAVVPTSVATTGGGVRLTTGADAGNTYALNGSRLELVRHFILNKVGLAFEARVAVSAITNLALFLGLSNQAGSSMPFTLAAGDVITSNPTDAVGFLFDTAGDTDNWKAIGVANNVDAALQDLGVAPTANINTYAVLRVEILSTGVATFYINGVKKGTAMTGALTAVSVGPAVAAFSRAAASINIDVDYILCEQHR